MQSAFRNALNNQNECVTTQVNILGPRVGKGLVGQDRQCGHCEG